MKRKYPLVSVAKQTNGRKKSNHGPICTCKLCEVGAGRIKWRPEISSTSFAGRKWTRSICIFFFRLAAREHRIDLSTKKKKFFLLACLNIQGGSQIVFVLKKITYWFCCGPFRFCLHLRSLFFRTKHTLAATKTRKKRHTRFRSCRLRALRDSDWFLY